MRITVKQLKQLIRETVEQMSSDEKQLESEDKKKNELIHHIIDANNQCGAHFSEKQLKEFEEMSVEDLKKVADHYDKIADLLK